MNKNVVKMAVATAVVGFTTIVGGHFADAKTIRVVKGDTLSKLAQENNTTIEKIAKENHISNINLIYVGQTLEVGEKAVAVQKQPVQSTPQVVTKKEVKRVSQAPKETVKHVYKAPQKQTVSKKQVVSHTVKTKSVSGSESAAKEWVAQRESSGSYGARSATGKYIGRYQLDKSYLHGDYSQANQERVANNYVKSRYGSWKNAKAHHEQYGWY